MAFRKVPRCPFLLIRAACRWQLKGTVGMMLTRENRRKTRLSATLPTTISHGVTRGRNHVSVARSPKLTARAIERPLKRRRLAYSILPRFGSYRAVNTARLYHKNQFCIRKYSLLVPQSIQTHIWTARARACVHDLKLLNVKPFGSEKEERRCFKCLNCWRWALFDVS